SSRRRHTRCLSDWSSDVCSSDLGRSTVLFAIVAIALLLVGIGAGYVLGRPATPAPLGPVNSLARASAIPRVDGWFRNASVSYLRSEERRVGEGWRCLGVANHSRD